MNMDIVLICTFKMHDIKNIKHLILTGLNYFTEICYFAKMFGCEMTSTKAVRVSTLPCDAYRGIGLIAVIPICFFCS